MAATRDRLSFLRPFAFLASLALVLALLYFGRAVLLPLALAVLLTFLLAPLVTGLQRRGLPRGLAVVGVVGAAFVAFAIIGWVVAWQATSLVDTLPDYEENLADKIAVLQSMSEGGIIDKVQVAIDRIRQQINRPSDPESAAALDSLQSLEGKPQPVRIVEDSEQALNLATAWTLLGPLLEPIATAALVVVLVIFLLLRREDMRDRLISLVGRGRLTLTTKALDEAGQRISRYLLMQLMLNASFGLSVAVGLFIIGVEYAFLWGFLAGVLRYIPYLGPWLAAIFPVSMAVLVTRGWTTPLAVVGLFLVLETINNMFLEPWLYGRNIGVSDAASIVAVAFWTWLWGPIGMVLAFPLTVCLVVVGRYVPALGFFDTLLGDRPALDPHIGFYQRLLAHDIDEASEIAEDHLSHTSLEAVYDEVLLPTLSYGRRDFDAGLIDDDEQNSLLSEVAEITGQLAEQSLAASRQEPDEQSPPAALPRVAIVACPAHDEADQLSLRMLGYLLNPEKCELEVVAPTLLATEVAAMVQQKGVKLVCIGALPPGGLNHARYLAKRLRACCADVKIVVGRFGLRSPQDKNREQLVQAGADYVAFSLSEIRQQIRSLLPVVGAQQTEDEKSTEEALETTRRSA
jgi:predicted PurR-regulated permease PerM